MPAGQTEEGGSKPIHQSKVPRALPESNRISSSTDSGEERQAEARGHRRIAGEAEGQAESEVHEGRAAGEVSRDRIASTESANELGERPANQFIHECSTPPSRVGGMQGEYHW